MQSYFEVTKSEASAYQQMKTLLTMTTDAQVLNYIKVKAINSFNPKNLVVGVPNWRQINKETFI